MLTPKKKKNAKLLDELHKFIEAGKAGRFGLRLDKTGLTQDEEEIARLLNIALDHFWRAGDNINMRTALINEALGIAMWDIDVVSADIANPNNKVKWSGEVRKMLGYSGENDFPDVLGSLTGKIHPDDAERCVGSFLAHVSDRTGNTPFDTEARIMAKSGEYRWIRTFGATQRDGAGVPLRVAGALRDVSERKQIENQNLIMSSIVRNSPSFVSCKKTSGELLYVNPSASVITGYPHEVLMKDDVGVIFGEKAPEVIKFVTEGLRDKGVVRYQFEGRRKDGELKTFAGTSFMIESDTYGTIAADITETKMLENSLREANERMMLMLDACPLCTQIFDKNLNLIECNEACVKIYGLESKQELFDDYIGRCFPKFQPDGQRSYEKAVLFMTKAFEDGRCDFDWTLQVPSDGTLIPTRVTLVKAKHGEDDILLAYTRDLRGAGSA
jgi:PAS domain S-box-containing protein